MVLIERSASVSDSNDIQGSASLAQRRPSDSAYDHVDDLFSEELQPADATKLLGERAASESFDDAMDAAALGGAASQNDSSDGPSSFGSPNETRSSLAMQRWRPWIIAAGAGFLGIAAAIGVIRLVVGATIGKRDSETISQVVAGDSMTRVQKPVIENSEVDPAVAQDPPELNDETDSAPETASLPGETPPPSPDTTAVAATDAAPPPTTDEIATNESDAPKPLDQFSALIGDKEIDPSDSRLEENEPEAPKVEIDDGGQSPGIMVIRNEPTGAELRERLGQVIPSIEFKRIPLYQFTEFVSDFTSVPITLRWESILHARSLVRRKVDVSVREDTTVEQLLTQVLDPIRLTAEIDGQQVFIQKHAKSQTSTTAYLVSDLVKSSYPIEDLSKLIQKMVQPGSWKRQGGIGRMKPTEDGRLAIRHTNEAHFEVVVLLEKLRVARGSKPLGTYPRELFDPGDRQLLLRELLSRSVAIRSNGSIRLTELFRQLGETSGCVMLPDWIAIRDLGWSPNTEVQVTSDEMTLAEMLEQVHEVFGLVFRGLDLRTLEITSPVAEQARHDFAFYDLKKFRENGFKASAIEERIQQAIGKERYDSVGAAVGIDRIGQQVIVRLPQSLHVLSRDFLNAWGG